MKKIIFILLVLNLLVLSGCNLTGKSVVDSNANEKIEECVKLCNDGSQSEEYFKNSCANILKYGGEETFNEYLESCR